MARFYGTLKGNRGEATRLGHAQTGGVRATARGWHIGAEVHAYAHHDDDIDVVSVGIGGGSNGTSRHDLALGTYARKPDGTLFAVDEVGAAVLKAVEKLRRKQEIARRLTAELELAPYQPKTGEHCDCAPGDERDNCPACEGTGERIDFAAIRARRSS